MLTAKLTLNEETVTVITCPFPSYFIVNDDPHSYYFNKEFAANLLLTRCPSTNEYNVIQNCL